MRPVSILFGNLFMISDRQGDVVAGPVVPLGLFFYDTRFLSTWRLTVNGGPVQALSVEALQYYESRFFLTPGEPTHYVDSQVSVFRHRWVGDAFEERVSVLNHAREPVELTVRLDIAADFAEVLEIKEESRRERRTTIVVEGDSLRMRYERETFVRETIVSSSAPAAVDEGGMTFTVRIAPHGTWHTDLQTATFIRGARDRDLRESMRNYSVRSRSDVQAALRRWVDGAPRLRTDYGPLNGAYRQSVVDLAALRYRGLNFDEPLPLAGMPWFMTLFGRDGLISCLQTVPFLPATCVPLLRILGLSQGSRRDPFRGEEPGKILQESRYGESAAFNELPHSADFSAADTTPLFVILLDEYERWTGDVDLVRELEFQTRAALEWIDRDTDLAGGGYLWYEPRPAMSGPVNQSWKGSPGAISFHDGRPAGYPQATCEIQGYVYDAKLRAARLARLVWHDPAFADRLEAEAAALRERFNRDFWIAERGYYAAALEADGRQVDSLTSNIGHLLWSGIVEPDRAASVVERLMGPDLFSGWGIRTLAATESRYNPLGYHTGTVWPADNSLIAWGMRRYGFRREPAVLAKVIIDATHYFGGQLPEAFAGYQRNLTKYPVLYSSASMPHAISAGAILLFLRTLLGLEPYGDNLTTDPAVPEEMGYVELRDIPGRWGTFDALGRGRTDRDPARRN
ncbi:glycogen debranching N-terminal domain-containing protein [Solwaraspora sp. WMMD1047]|uniref:amylo-alpha-1,6-glucosidase n=1 Tax=Solwaraspora sp. WMMD1047 TaxID=3016102 RepID=UPI002417D8EC|nr:glycogen debranching N-terminal domain-containing protein [Solwaraspora sp. WMMD1047]MDG4834432.1 glycogen debranching N-terminal domain-containing protein [Solwaraspora sp. WMMD1047]